MAFARLVAIRSRGARLHTQTLVSHWTPSRSLSSVRPFSCLSSHPSRNMLNLHTSLHRHCLPRSLSVSRAVPPPPLPPPAHPSLTWLAAALGAGLISLSSLASIGVSCKEGPCEQQVAAIADGLLLERKEAEEGEKQAEEEEEHTLWKLLTSSWLDSFCLLGAAFTTALSALISTQIPTLVGKFLDTYSKAGAPPLLQSALIFCAVLAVHAALKLASSALLSFSTERLCGRIQALLFKKILSLDMFFFDRTETGELVDCLSGDVQELRASVKHTISMGLRNAMSLVGGFAALLSISPKLTAVLGLVLPVLVGCGSLYGGVLRRLRAQAREQEGVLSAKAHESLSNIRTVRAFANEDFESDRFEAKVKDVRALNARTGTGIGLFHTLVSLAFSGVTLVTLFAGGRLIDQGEMTAGQLASFMMHGMRLQSSLAQVSVLLGELSKGGAAAERILTLLNRRPTTPIHGGRIPSLLGPGHVRFDNLTFAYPTRPEMKVFKNFTLELKENTMTALVGPSGAGKSTVVALLERLYDPDEGQVIIDGVPLRDLDPSWFRGSMTALVSQEPTLFSTSIRDNIRYGRPTASDADVERAAVIANAHSFILDFPEGYETKCGERGVALSGGQKQRVAIARAVLKNPKILILDEATSALDAASERAVQEALERLMVGRTTLVIAHRLSTIQKADNIAVLADGQVVEQGTHEELIKARGVYRDLVAHQVEPRKDTVP